MFPTVKAFFALWLYYPEKNGIQLIENLIGEHLVKAFEKANKIVGKDEASLSWAFDVEKDFLLNNP